MPVLRIYNFEDKGDVTAAVKLTWEQGIRLGEKLKVLVEEQHGYYSESAAEKLFKILQLKGNLSKI